MTETAAANTVPATGVYKAIAKVMEGVKHIPKTGRNEFHKYDYATEADIVDHLRPLMAKAGLVMLSSQGAVRDEIQTTGNKPQTVVRILHTFTFVATEDGSYHTIQVWGEGQDNADKGSYKAFTGAEKYALLKTFLVPTGDDPEQSHAGDGEATAQRTQARASQEVLDQIQETAARVQDALTEAQRAAVARFANGAHKDAADKMLGFLVNIEKEARNAAAKATANSNGKGPEDERDLADAAAKALELEATAGVDQPQREEILAKLNGGEFSLPSTVAGWDAYIAELEALAMEVAE